METQKYFFIVCVIIIGGFAYMGHLYRTSTDERFSVEQDKTQEEDLAEQDTVDPQVSSDGTQYPATQSAVHAIHENIAIDFTDNDPILNQESDESANVVDPAPTPDVPATPLPTPPETNDAQSKATLIELTEIYIDTIDEVDTYISKEIRRAREMENVMAGESGGRVGDLIEATADYVRMYRQHYTTTQSLIGDLLTAAKATLNTYKYTDVSDFTNIDSLITNTQSATQAIAKKLVDYRRDKGALDDYYTQYCEVKQEYLQEQCETID